MSVGIQSQMNTYEYIYKSHKEPEDNRHAYFIPNRDLFSKLSLVAHTSPQSFHNCIAYFLFYSTFNVRSKHKNGFKPLYSPF